MIRSLLNSRAIPESNAIVFTRTPAKLKMLAPAITGEKEK
jgi:hypothetical protein